MRRMGYLPYVGLPNILAGELLVPEFLQDEATPGALANALLELLHDAGAQRRQIEKFHEIHDLLRQNTAEKAADAVLGVIDAGRRLTSAAWTKRAAARWPDRSTPRRSSSIRRGRSRA